MLHNPEHWKAYYPKDALEAQLARRYSYSDRSRYYWPEPSVQGELERLLANLSSSEIPLTLLSQHMPQQYGLLRRERSKTALPLSLKAAFARCLKFIRRLRILLPIQAQPPVEPAYLETRKKRDGLRIPCPLPSGIGGTSRPQYFAPGLPIENSKETTWKYSISRQGLCRSLPEQHPATAGVHKGVPRRVVTKTCRRQGNVANFQRNAE